MDPELDFNTVRDFATAPLIGALIGIERLSFGRATSAGASAHYALASGIILAWCIMFARVVIEVLIVNPALVASILAPFGAMEVVAALFAWIYVVAALAGLTDVDAIALSMAGSARTGDASMAANAIVKCGIVMTVVASALKPPIAVATAAILANGLVFL